MVLGTREQEGLKTERDMVRTAIATNRVLLGLFFILSAIANAIYFNSEGGLLQIVLQSKLSLWGWGFEGIGPLPPILAYPYAYLLIPVEIVVGVLFIINRWVRWAGILMMLMLVSFILAFGLFPADGILPKNQANWDKNVFLLTGAWICTAYDHYWAKRKERQSEM